MGGADSTPYCFFWGPRYYTGSSSLSAYTIERLCPKPWWIFKSLISHHSGSQRSVVWPENLFDMQSNYFVKQLVSRVAEHWLVIPSSGTMSSPTQANMPVYWVMAFSVFRVFYVTWCLSSFSLISSTAPKVGGRWVSTPLPKISQCFGPSFHSDKLEFSRLLHELPGHSSRFPSGDNRWLKWEAPAASLTTEEMCIVTLRSWCSFLAQTITYSYPACFAFFQLCQLQSACNFFVGRQSGEETKFKSLFRTWTETSFNTSGWWLKFS